MRPAVGSIRRLSSRTRVDLPEPDKPMITKISPASMVKLASNTPIDWPVCSTISVLERPSRASAKACCGLSPKTLKTFSMWMVLAMHFLWLTPRRKTSGPMGRTPHAKAGQSS